MKAHDLVELAGRNLRESLLRNALTTLGIAVGVASLVAMLSLGVGLQELAGRRLKRSGLFDTIVVYPSADLPNLPRARQQVNPAPASSRPLDQGARREMERLSNVVEVYPELRFMTEVRSNGCSQFTMVTGLSPSARDNDAFDGMQGRFFSGPLAEEAILQSKFARHLAEQPIALIGQELVVRYAERQPLAGAREPHAAANDNPEGGERPWGFSVVRREKKLRIVGIVESEPYSSVRGLGRGGVYIPIQVAENLRTLQISNLRDAMRTSPSTLTYPSLIVRVSDPAHVQATQDAIKPMGFSTFSLLDATRNLRRFFAVLDLFLGIFGSLALAVASLGIINTLVMSILERRREIGIMKALGASDADVKRLFFAEASAMGLVGGTLGVALGWGLGRAINFGANIYLQRRDLPPETIWSVPWWLVAGAIGFAVLVSLVSGLYPAARAAKLDPVQALRYE